MQKKSPLPKAFADLGVEIRFLKALRKMKFKQPSEIQAGMIPNVLDGHDVIGQARTGTGKTAAFALPVLQQLDPEEHLQALCLVPTRELAVQVVTEIKRMAEFTDLHVVAVYGGTRVASQIHALGKKPHFVVGTPGRVIDMINRRALDISEIEFIVLDEVDRMLDIGFRDDIRQIMGKIVYEHQTVFVSATLTDEIKRLTKRYMVNPVEVNVSQDRLTVDAINQSYVSVESPDKFRALKLILEQEDPPFCIVFSNTKAMARKLAKKLHDGGISASEIHGDLMQAKRDRVMKQFRKQQVRVLVATDLAARGIDVSNISHIINYDIPPDPQVYVHRIGRTARMGAKGTAITFVNKEEGKELTTIEMLINSEVPERKIPGFEPRVFAEEKKEEEATKPPPVARTQALLHGSDEDAKKAPKKTIGSKFRPSRSRRKF
ncbi:MAG: DEAD/DEAH box helicase [Phycisphaerae bacterium]